MWPSYEEDPETEKLQALPYRAKQAREGVGGCTGIIVVVLVVGAYQHCSHEGLLYSHPPMEFRHSSPEALHTKRRERPLLAKDGTKAKEFS
jgi:hypothetical protein